MIKYSSDLKYVVAKLEADIERLVSSDIIARTAAFDSLALVVSRVQQRGQNSADSQMKAYIASYAKKRKEKGRQVSYKDLTFSGDMIRNFQPFAISTGWAVGFTSAKQARKADENEDREGEIFSLSGREIQLVRKNIVILTQKLLLT